MKALFACEFSMEFLALFLTKYFEKKDIESKKIHEDLSKMIKCAMWGNRCDLSQTGGDAIELTESPLKLVESLQELMLVDESPKIVDFLCTALNTTNDETILGNCLQAYIEIFVFNT